MALTERRRHVRELVGWTIISTVVTLARLAVWVDGAIGIEDEEGGDERQ